MDQSKRGVPLRLSWSQVNQYARCPRAYYFQRIQELLSRPAYALVSGSSAHKGLEIRNREVLSGGEPPAPDAVVEAAVAAWEDSDFEDKRKEKDRFVEDVSSPITEYCKKIAPSVDARLTGVEEQIDFEIGGVPFLGFCDVVCEDRFADYKLIGRRKTEKDVRIDPQFMLYSEVLGRHGDMVGLLRGGKAYLAQARPTKEERACVLGWVRSVVAQIKTARASGDFPRCDPRSWYCSRTGCEYWFECYGRKGDV